MGIFDLFTKKQPVQSRKKDIHDLIEDLRQDRSRESRQAAADELAARGEAAVYPLIGALNDSDWRVREESAKILGRIGDTRALKHLIQRFRDEKTRVQLWSTDAIIRMGADASGPLIEALDDQDRRIRMGAIVALGELEEPQALGPLKRLLEGGDENISEAAKEAIENIEASRSDRA